MGVQSLSRALAGRLFGVRETQGFSPARAQRFVKQLESPAHPSPHQSLP